MNCNEYLPLLSGHLDGANSAAEEARLHKHLASCKQCRTLLEQFEKADAMLLASKVEPPADLTARIMTQVRQEAKQKKTKRHALWSVGTAGFVAAALLALVFLGDLKLPSLKQDDGVPTVMVYADAESDLSSTDALPERADFSLFNEGFATEQAADSDNNAYADSNTPKTAAGTAPNTEMVTPSEGLLWLPSLNDTGIEGIDNALESAEDMGTPHRMPSFLTTSDSVAPLLVIRGADAEELSAAYDLSLTSEDVPTAASDTDSLYGCLLASLPSAITNAESTPQQGTAPTVSVYLVDYSQFSTIFADCVGVYETAVYYPTELSALESCTVLVIS